jgi:TonB family protein
MSDDEALAEQIASGGDWEEQDSGGSPADSEKKNRDAEDTRTTETMAEVVKANRHLFRLCYEKVQKKDPKLQGDVVITFTVTPQGRVKSAELNLEKSTLKNEEVGKCAIEEMKKLTFSESSLGMESTMNYPFNFNPR